MLLKAGMSVKRAVCYNILSSALCLGGMVCGVLAGHAPSATRWLFAVAAGMFLYIALVDMVSANSFAINIIEDIIIEL